VDVVHPVAHDELRAVLELRDEVRDLVEVVGEVRVGHDDVRAAGGGEAGHVRAAVATARLVHDACAGAGRQLGAAVLGGVVGDDDLAIDPSSRHHLEREAHAVLDVAFFVEAGDDDRDVRLIAPAGWRGARDGVLLERAHEKRGALDHAALRRRTTRQRHESRAAGALG
jgi:hypothetical protein